MNDRFKIRVYNKREKRMIYDVTYLNPLLLDERLSDEAKNYVVMQCIGLKDKKRKLIYEDDILIYTACQNDKDVDCKLIVVYNSEECCFEFHDLKGEFWGYIRKKSVLLRGEIIGNIYENKELLNADI